jgi:hypothetical protein
MASENLDEEKEEVRIPGLYPSKAIKDIKNVNDVICSVQKVFATAINNYFDKLYDLWSSPKALDFYGRASSELTSITDEIINFNESIISELVASFNRIAPSHRESSISVAKGAYTSLKLKPLLEIAANGKIGMKDKLVDNATTDFLMQIKNIVNKTSPIPDTIYFYDTDGKLAGSCNTKVSELRSILEKGLSKANLLTSIVDEATTTTRSAAKNAASILNTRS